MFMKRKKIKGFALIVLLAVGTAVYLAACKKDIVTPLNNMGQNEYPGYTGEAKVVAGKIIKFKQQLDDREYVTRSGLYMPIDSIIWNVEALFNAEYTFSERKYSETVRQELEFFVDVNADGEAPFDVVADLYDEITSSVRQAYANDGINTDKSLMAVVVDKGETVGNRVTLKVCVVSGKMEDSSVSFKDPVPGPFGPDDCWYFGEYGGTCDDPSVFGDAAEIIEDTINYYYHGTKVPQSGFRKLHHDMLMVSLEGSEYFDSDGNPYLYFYSTNGNPPTYLNGDLLNYYYTRELEVLLHLLPADLVAQGIMPAPPAFIEVDIVGMMGYVGNGSYYHHNNYVIYGSSLDIPSHVLPPQRDLLNN